MDFTGVLRLEGDRLGLDGLARDDFGGVRSRLLLLLDRLLLSDSCSGLPRRLYFDLELDLYLSLLFRFSSDTCFRSIDRLLVRSPERDRLLGSSFRSSFRYFRSSDLLIDFTGAALMGDTLLDLDCFLFLPRSGVFLSRFSGVADLRRLSWLLRLRLLLSSSESLPFRSLDCFFGDLLR